jgi:hypothetical protein
MQVMLASSPGSSLPFLPSLSSADGAAALIPFLTENRQRDHTPVEDSPEH